MTFLVLFLSHFPAFPIVRSLVSAPIFVYQISSRAEVSRNFLILIPNKISPFPSVRSLAVSSISVSDMFLHGRFMKFSVISLINLSPLRSSCLKYLPGRKFHQFFCFFVQSPPPFFYGSFSCRQSDRCLWYVTEDSWQGKF